MLDTVLLRERLDRQAGDRHGEGIKLESRHGEELGSFACVCDLGSFACVCALGWDLHNKTRRAVEQSPVQRRDCASGPACCGLKFKSAGRWL
eukprot:981797-Rhodomonas_salina.2